MNNEQLDLASIYGIPSCAGGDCSPGAVFTPTNPSPSTPGNRIPTLEEIAGYNIQNPKIPAPLPQIQPTPGQSVPMTGSNVGESTSHMQSQTPSTNPLAPLMPTNQPPPISGESLQYLNGFLRTQLGRTVTVEFLVGANTLVDRTGVLLAVGANYILINEIQTDDITACDFYNIKFIRFYY